MASTGRPPADAAPGTSAGERLRRAGRAIFARDGFVAATVRDITAEADVNRATFYSHHPSKADLMLAVCEDVIADAPLEWRLLDDALSDRSEAGLRAWLGTALGWWERHADILPALREFTAVDAGARARLGAAFADIGEHLPQHLGRVGGAGRARRVLVLQLLIVQLDQVAVEWLARGTESRADLLDLLGDLWSDVLVDR